VATFFLLRFLYLLTWAGCSLSFLTSYSGDFLFFSAVLKLRSDVPPSSSPHIHFSLPFFLSSLSHHPRGRSYVVGYGVNPPLRAHHRAASCPTSGPCGWDNYNSPAPNPNILRGALVGGPPQPDDASYEDIRTNYQTNEVAIDYNAGFTGALAGLIQWLQC
jgi:hypothetical protein